MSGHVKLPGSKSLSNRILLLAALSEGTTLVRNLLVSGRTHWAAQGRGVDRCDKLLRLGASHSCACDPLGPLPTHLILLVAPADCSAIFLCCSCPCLQEHSMLDVTSA